MPEVHSTAQEDRFIAFELYFITLSPISSSKMEQLHRLWDSTTDSRHFSIKTLSSIHQRFRSLVFFSQSTDLFLEWIINQTHKAMVTSKITRFSFQRHTDVAVGEANKAPPLPLKEEDPVLVISLSIPEQQDFVPQILYREMFQDIPFFHPL